MSCDDTGGEGHDSSINMLSVERSPHRRGTVEEEGSESSLEEEREERPDTADKTWSPSGERCLRIWRETDSKKGGLRWMDGLTGEGSRNGGTEPGGENLATLAPTQWATHSRMSSATWEREMTVSKLRFHPSFSHPVPTHGDQVED
ncbi:hypothetical protein EYF80_032340 [Liparis tanakae]|uniref:Uncharacterized protein n=1 Tax=Liparis tanakae TaxID=230148 RepID=A0A4Z2GXN9_9TELE|nr:hypothetical protein EYF80_032340 [Liparis tanakae]